MKYQIRDARFGLALREGDHTLDVLTDFLHVRERADVRSAIKVVRVDRRWSHAAVRGRRGQTVTARASTLRS